MYLYGGHNQGALVQLALNLRQRFPGVRIVGGYSPPHRALSAEEERAVAEEINRSRADVVWIGIGVPKQEKWMARMRPLLQAPVLIGVGAAFDFHAGLVPQAPNWLQEAGLEWAYRLAHEPRRLWRRYVRYNPRFLSAFARQFARHQRGGHASLTGFDFHRARAPRSRSRHAARAGYLEVTLASIVPQAEQLGAEVIVVSDGPDPASRLGGRGPRRPPRHAARSGGR